MSKRSLGRFVFAYAPRVVRPLVIVVLTVLVALAFPVEASAQAHVRTSSHPSGVWLHERATAEAAWRDLCAAPCEADVSEGWELGLSLEGLTPQPVATPTLVDGSRLQLRYDDQHLTRTYGLILTVIGVVGAATLGIGGIVSWLSANGLGDMTGPVTSMVSGAAVLALGLSVGIVLMGEGDHLEITVLP